MSRSVAEPVLFERVEYGTTVFAYLVPIGASVCGLNVYVGVVLRQSNNFVLAAIIAVLLAMIAAVFWKMTIRVTNASYEVRLGIPAVARRIGRREISAVDVVAAPSLLAGFGMRTRGPQTWWRINDGQIVSVTLRSGRSFGVSTTDATALCAALTPVRRPKR